MTSLSRRVLGLFIALCAEVLAVTLIRELPNDHVSAQDVIVYKMNSYFKGENKTISFVSKNENALKPVPSFIPQGVKASVGSSCTLIQKGRKNSLDLVFGLCSDGTEVVKIVYDPDNQKLEQPMVTKKVAGVTCYDMKLDALNRGLYLACKRTIDGAEVIFELSVDEFEFTQGIDIKRESHEAILAEPALAIDVNSTSINITLYDKNPADDSNVSIRLIYKKDGTLKQSYYYGNVNSTLSTNILFSKIRNIYMDQGQLFVLIDQGSKPKLTSCKNVDEVLYCKDVIDLFESVDSSYFAAFELISPTVCGVVYVAENKLIRKRYNYPSLTHIIPDQVLYFEKKVDVSKPVVAKGIENEFVVTATLKDNSGNVVVYWDMESGYVSSSYNTGISLTCFHCRYSHSDTKKYEALYFDTKLKTFDVFRAADFKFKVVASDQIFSKGDNITLPFTVSDDSATRDFSITIRVLVDPFTKYSLATKAVYNMYKGTKAPLPISIDAFEGNAPTFEVSIQPSTAKATVNYAEKVTAAMPKIDDSETILSMALNIGHDNFLLDSENQWNIFKCTFDSTRNQVDCIRMIKVECKERVIDAKYELNMIHILTEAPPEEGGTIPRIGIHNFDYQNGERFLDPQYYNIDAREAIGALRIHRKKVYIDLLSKSSDTQEWAMFSGEYEEESAFPTELIKSSLLPPHVCPKQVMWSPKKEPTVFVVSLCEGGKREVIQFEINYAHVEQLRQVKTYTLATQGKTGICLSGFLMIVIDYDGKKIYGIDRRTSQDSRVEFPFTALNMPTIVSHTCSRYNSYFQIIASKQESTVTKNFLITYRTNSINDPNKRMHSILPITSTNPKIAVPSAGTGNQELFTVIYNQDSNNLNDPESVLFEIDVPKIQVNLQDVSKTQYVDLQTTIKPDPKLSRESSIQSALRITVHDLEPDINFKPITGTDGVVKLNAETKERNLDKIYKVNGVVLDSMLEGPEDSKKRFSLTKRFNYDPKYTEGITDSLVGARLIDNFVFGWNSEALFVYENTTRVAHFPGVFVVDSEAVTGTYKNPKTQESVTYYYLQGFSKRHDSNEAKLFVVFKEEKTGVWKYAEAEAPEGTIGMEVMILDPVKSRFCYVLNNGEEDYIQIGHATLVYNRNEQHYNLVITDSKVIKKLDKKIDKFEILYVGGVVRIIYNPRNTPDIFSLSVNPETLEALGEVEMNFGNDDDESFAESIIRCSEYYSPSKIIDDPIEDPDRKFFCVFTTKRYFSYGVTMEYYKDPTLPPKVVQRDIITNIMGFQPVSVRVQMGYAGIIYKMIPDFDTKIGSPALVNDSVLVLVWRNGDDNSHALIPLSSFGIPHYNKEFYAKRFYNVDFLQITNETAKMTLSSNIPDKTIQAVMLSPLKLSSNSIVNSEEINDLKISFQGLSGTNTVFPLRIYLEGKTEDKKDDKQDVKPKGGSKNLGVIILVVSGVLMFMLCAAGAYHYYSSRSSLNLDHEPETIAIKDAGDISIGNIKDSEYSKA